MNKFSSMYFPYLSAIFRSHILMEFNHRMLKSDRDSFTSENLTSHCINADDNYFPLVVLIGGVEGSGKSSFITYCKNHMPGVLEQSTIDCCKELVEHMASMESAYYGDSLYESIKNKDERYRTLLSHLKSLWCEIDDGPNSIVCDVANNVFNRAVTPILFINVREPEQIEHLKHRIEDECNVTVITLAVLRNDPTDAMNDSDKHTLEYDYDIWIKNSMTLVELEFAALQLCLSVENSNRVVHQLYG